MTDKEQALQEYLDSNSPTTPLDHATAFAWLNTLKGVTQKQYSNAVAISDRSLRKYITDNKAEYDFLVSEYELDKKPEIDLASLNSRTMSEEQIDKFIHVLYQSAITGNARDRQLLIDFTGMTASDVMTFQNTKASNVRWFIKSTLSYISKYLNTKSMGVMLESSNYLYRGDKASSSNPQTFVDADISDESFMREMAYMGMLFTSIYDNVEHPDLETLATAVRLDRVEKGIEEKYDKIKVKEYARGESLSDKKAPPLTDKQLRESFKGSYAFTDEEIEELISIRNKAKDIVKAPKASKPDVIARTSKYEDELTVILSAEEQMRQWMKDQPRKLNKKLNTEEND